MPDEATQSTPAWDGAPPPDHLAEPSHLVFDRGASLRLMRYDPDAGVWWVSSKATVPASDMHGRGYRYVGPIPPMRKGSGWVSLTAGAVGLLVGVQMPLIAAHLGAGWLGIAAGSVLALVIAVGAAAVASEWWNENQPGWRDEGMEELDRMRAELEQRGWRRHGH